MPTIFGEIDELDDKIEDIKKLLGERVEKLEEENQQLKEKLKKLEEQIQQIMAIVECKK